MIDVQEVSRTYRRGASEVHALRGVSFALPGESFTFILGPSGSGKSTLLYLLGALDDPTSGTVQVDDRNLSDLLARERDEYRRERVGFVFQDFNLLRNLSALDNVLVPFLPVGIPTELRARAIELLQQVGLGGRLEHRPHQLSGGEQQRVAVARALLKQPLLVLADEPTGELDSEAGEQVFEYLRRLQSEQQTTVVVATHDRRYITDADRTLELRDGRLDGSP